MKTKPRVLIGSSARGDVNYWVFTPLDEEARQVLQWAVEGPEGTPSLFETGDAFVDGDAIWVREESNPADHTYQSNADYVYQGLLINEIAVCWSSGESVQLSQEALDDYNELCESISSAAPPAADADEPS